MIWTLSINDHRPGHEANQSCSSVKWVVPGEVLEEGYGHIVCLQGLGRTPLIHLSTVSHVAKSEKSVFEASKRLAPTRATVPCGNEDAEGPRE